MKREFKYGDIVTPIWNNIIRLIYVKDNPSNSNEAIVCKGNTYLGYRKSDLRHIGLDKEEFEYDMHHTMECFPDYGI